MPDEPGQRVYDVPEECSPPLEPALAPAAPKPQPAAPRPAIQPPPKPAPESASPAGPAPIVGGNWWRTLTENCKGRLPPMYRAFLDMCSGALAGDLLTVYAPDDITAGRLDNERVRGALAEEAEKIAGGPVRLALCVGEPPQAAPEENLKELLQFSSQYDNIEVK